MRQLFLQQLGQLEHKRMQLYSELHGNEREPQLFGQCKRSVCRNTKQKQKCNRHMRQLLIRFMGFMDGQLHIYAELYCYEREP